LSCPCVHVSLCVAQNKSVTEGLIDRTGNNNGYGGSGGVNDDPNGRDGMFSTRLTAVQAYLSGQLRDLLVPVGSVDFGPNSPCVAFGGNGRVSVCVHVLYGEYACVLARKCARVRA
jgi:hypothetical protein